MLDQQHGDAEPVADRTDQRAEFRDLFVIEAAGRLVEQQQQRPGGKRARQLDALARAQRQTRRRPFCHVLQPDEGQHGARGLLEFALLAPRERQRQRVGQGTVAAARVGADLDVVEHRHRGEQGRAWKVRPTPSAAMSDGAQRRSDCPFSRMSPRTGR